MPFFPFGVTRKISWNKNKNNRTSPVRNSHDCRTDSKTPECEKRALLPALRKTAWTASMAVEAALVLPLFLFSCVCLLAPIKLFDCQRQVQGALEQVGEELSQYAYIQFQMEKGNGTIDSPVDAESLLGLGYVRLKMEGQLDRDWLEQVSFGGSEILSEEEEIRLVMNYRVRLPFSVLGVKSIPMESVCVRRAWVGAEGGRESMEGTGEAWEEEQVVYVGKNPTRYHTNPGCHYISNDLRAVSREQAEELRNSQGGKYAPCARCGGRDSATVYITPSGTSYHTIQDCTSIIAYVRAVKLSQVAHLGCCSYCERLAGRAGSALGAAFSAGPNFIGAFPWGNCGLAVKGEDKRWIRV